MKRVFVLSLMLTFVMLGCAEDDQPAKETVMVVNKSSSEGSGEQNTASFTKGSSKNTELLITPENPVAGDCLEVNVKGLADTTFVWNVSGLDVQENNNNRYCLESASRDDVVTVKVGTSTGEKLATVILSNSLPRVLDTKFEFVEEEGAYFVEVSPQTEDADKDYVELSFQWLINGRINEGYIGNRLPANAYQSNDNIQVKVTPDDGYGKGKTYTSRSLEMLNAAPAIISQPPKFFEALEYTYQVEANDMDSGELMFLLEEAPEGMMIHKDSGLVTWPLSNVAAGEYQVKIIVTDSDGGTGWQEYTLKLENGEQ